MTEPLPPPSAFAENLRSALFQEPTLIQGYVMMSLLKATAPVEIIGQIKSLMSPIVVPEEKLKLIYSDVHNVGLGYTFKNVSLNWREARMAVATHNFSQYQLNPSVLDRIVAIDETSILTGRLVLIAAVIKFRFLAFDFIVTGKATNAIVEEFLSQKVAPSLKAIGNKDPILIWDNINVHKGTAVSNFLANNNWTVWPHPVDSPDLMPLDFSDFKQMRTKAREGLSVAGLTVEGAQAVVVEAINGINREGSLRGIALLPEIWESLIESKGLNTRS